MDSVSPEARHRIMAAIRGRDTSPELALRSALHARGFRFRVDARDLPGRPDLKLTRYGAVIFVNGCFWHGHDCARFRAPSSNRAFWIDKVSRNRERDLRVVRELRGSGWRVCVVWECALKSAAFRKNPERLVEAVAAWLAGNRGFLEIFDHAAVAGKSAGRDGGARSLGRNSVERIFAAERQAAYRGLPAAAGQAPVPPRVARGAKRRAP